MKESMNQKIYEIARKGAQWAAVGIFSYCTYWLVKNMRVTATITYPEQATYESPFQREYRNTQGGMNFKFDSIIRKNDIVIDVVEVEKEEDVDHE
jgi:hypothetical protein